MWIEDGQWTFAEKYTDRLRELLQMTLDVSEVPNPVVQDDENRAEPELDSP